MLNTPGVYIAVPEAAPASGPIPLKVTMVADMQAYTANNGILDNALDIALIRRDGPGLKFVSKLDPHAMMAPDTPLPPELPPGTDPENTGFITETREFDLLDYGAEHDGAAEYYVLAGFAGRVSKIAPLVVQHESHSLPADGAEPVEELISPDRSGIPGPPDIPGIAARMNEKKVCVEGGLRVTEKSPKFPDEEGADPFVTIVVVRLSPAGGMWGRSFDLDFDRKGREITARFSVSLLSDIFDSDPGRYGVYVFSGDEVAGPIEFRVPEHD